MLKDPPPHLWLMVLALAITVPSFAISTGALIGVLVNPLGWWGLPLSAVGLALMVVWQRIVQREVARRNEVMRQETEALLRRFDG